MKRSAMATGICAAMGMLILILDSKTALSGAREGLDLCIRTVIPSLFPFFVLSILLTGSLTGQALPFLRPLRKFTGIPHGAESILLAGLLGGYPVGAQSIGRAHSEGLLSDGDARRMLAFCNNAGPAFLFGMASSLFPEPWMPWALWGIHMASALLASRLIPGRSGNNLPLHSAEAPTLPAALTGAVRIMGQVCGWVVLFRVVLAFLQRWFAWLLPVTLQVILAGLLELSNGCCALASIGDIPLRFILCAAMLAFGGLCVGFQTVTAVEGVDLGLYFPGKILQTIFSILLSASVMYPRIGLLPAVMGVILCAIHAKRRNNSSIPAAVGV